MDTVTNQGEAPTRAAVYLRISQDKTGESAGVGRQREDCLALVDGQRWALADIYIDNDLSASSGKPRPEYKRMLKDIQAGLVDAVVAWHPDRLYRKLADLEGLIEAIDKNDVIMRTVRAGEIDLSTPTGRMLARILGATAQAEGEIKADRWSRSWKQGREAGAPARTGSRLFGYDRDGELVEDEADIARRMAVDVISGVPILTVARKLEADGVLTTRGSVWRPGTIRQYLANPRIAGLSTLHGKVVAEGQWRPILDRDTWETVRALLTSRARGTKPRKSLLNGLIFCGGTHANGDPCGHRMITSGQRGKRTYRCPNRPGMPGCGKVSGNAEPIEQIVEDYARGRLEDPAVREHIRRLSLTGAPAALAEIANLEDRIAELEDQLEQPGVPIPEILRARDRCRERLVECQRELTASTPGPLPRSGGEWPDDLERRRRLVDLVVERVELAKANPGKWFDPTRVEVVPR